MQIASALFIDHLLLVVVVAFLIIKISAAANSALIRHICKKVRTGRGLKCLFIILDLTWLKRLQRWWLLHWMRILRHLWFSLPFLVYNLVYIVWSCLSNIMVDWDTFVIKAAVLLTIWLSTLKNYITSRYNCWLVYFILLRYL